ncbi:MAG: histidinol-phosphatase HisJ family protein [Lachnospiraceae bacterium]|nr:histidinol-phosphatase HisJ family protein [Lachnospiraceae bacterium]
MIKTDLHMHSAFSADSEALPRDNIEAALEKGLDTICFTDHIDYDFPDPEILFDFNIEDYFHELTALREEYEGRIRILIGVEMGMQPHLGERISKTLHDWPFDFCIGSQHVVFNTDPYYQTVWEEYPCGMVYRKYLEETLENVSVLDCFDVLGHLDYVTRYGVPMPEGKNDEVILENMDLIDEILKVLIRKDKGLEINSAAYRKDQAWPNPNPLVIRRYLELGGEIITVGADAHRSMDVAADFDRVKEVLEACNVRALYRYIRRKPERIEF